MLQWKTNKKLEYRRSRLEVISHLGGKCVHCGFNDFRALQFDHAKGDIGLRDIRSFTNWKDYHKAILEDTTEKYQLLCANCNWIKRYNNEEHPQPRGITLSERKPRDESARSKARYISRQLGISETDARLLLTSLTIASLEKPKI